ncbi:hypothetical protein EIP91_008908 [Steccherinum ochraceum]|uniref:TECPR1-like DysF domain-containing protein n=1 Tax=Steccherinum ochraceum TaxID=92696 RepID=A0A4V2MXU6_9APHY|nr:hypothetical protein EIP91_008908 [Steccherinum ochraceum]
MADTQDTVHDTEVGPSSQPAPPACMHTDERSGADQARRRLLPKRSFLAGLLPARRRSQSHAQNQSYEQVPSPNPNEPADGDVAPPNVEQLVRLETRVNLDPTLEEDYDKDVYRWAVLYENQRGLTFFSTPYYSPLSLLPMDPPAFTIPSAMRSPRAGQPTVSLSSYPLPDGTWRWVSRSWMIDMRGDGQTQYDGFEYNWFFRGKKWRSEAGNLSTGGLVRRRRWVRLMMRPAQVPAASDAGQTLAGDSVPPLFENGATRPPSVISFTDSGVGDGEVWEGDEEEDWLRCKVELKRIGRDGRKLELWRMWLGKPGPESSPPSQSTQQINQQKRADGLSSSATSLSAEDVSFAVGPAPRERLASVLRHHGTEILQSFVYPDSRAQFVELLASAALLPDLQTTPGSPSPLAMDFWSYASSLDKLSKLDGSPRPHL